MIHRIRGAVAPSSALLASRARAATSGLQADRRAPVARGGWGWGPDWLPPGLGDALACAFFTKASKDICDVNCSVPCVTDESNCLHVWDSGSSLRGRLGYCCNYRCPHWGGGAGGGGRMEPEW